MKKEMDASPESSLRHRRTEVQTSRPLVSSSCPEDLPLSFLMLLSTSASATSQRGSVALSSPATLQGNNGSQSRKARQAILNLCALRAFAGISNQSEAGSGSAAEQLLSHLSLSGEGGRRPQSRRVISTDIPSNVLAMARNSLHCKKNKQNVVYVEINV